LHAVHAVLSAVLMNINHISSYKELH